MYTRQVPEYDDSRGLLYAATHDPFLLHFLHRWWAFAVLGVLIVLARRVRSHHRRASVAVHSAVGTQILLGIATVLTGVALWIAVAHQGVGALLVMAVVWCLHVDGRRKPA